MLDRARDGFTSVRWFMEDHFKVVIAVIAALLVAAAGFFVWQTFFHAEAKEPSSFEGVPLVLKPRTETSPALYPEDASPECKSAADSLNPTVAYASWVDLLGGMDAYQAACVSDVDKMIINQELNSALLVKSPYGNPSATPDYTKMEECSTRDQELTEAISAAWRDSAAALDALSAECDARSLTSTQYFKQSLTTSLLTAELQQPS